MRALQGYLKEILDVQICTSMHPTVFFAQIRIHHPIFARKFEEFLKVPAVMRLLYGSTFTHPDYIYMIVYLSYTYNGSR